MNPPLAMRLYSQIARRTPLLSGLTPLSFNRITNWSFGPKNMIVEAVTQGGIRISVDTNDYHGRILYIFGTNDPKVQSLTYELLGSDDNFLDIGANYSTIGLFAAQRAHKVHLFEPQPHIADRVQQAIHRSSLLNVTVHRVALLDREDAMTMHIPPAHSGMATLVQHSDQANWKTMTVPVRKIDDYASPLVQGRRFGVKIDVEGAEPHLIPWIVAQPNLKFMIFEAAHNHDTLFAQIKDAGFTIFGLRRNLLRKQVERVDSVSELRRFHDLVAVKPKEKPHVVSMRDLASLL